ncbi:hypothetical protein BC835DRAFT_1414874 [Cytidiella melzeri]|nr:hypothetical protein BC835DRAFT_1414874 [Cytidiella melzeri]
MSSASRAKGKGKAIDGRYSTDARKDFPHCGESFAVRGFASHFRKCNDQKNLDMVIAARRHALELAAEQSHSTRKRAADYEVLQRTPKRGRLIRQRDRGPSTSRLSSPDSGELLMFPFLSAHHLTSRAFDRNIARHSHGLPGWEAVATGEEPAGSQEDTMPQVMPPILSAEPEGPSDNQSFMPEAEEPVTNPVVDPRTNPKVDDIRVEYHRAAGLSPRFFALHEFRREKRTIDLSLSKSNPWKPFKTRLDFEVAEFTQKACLNKSLIDGLFKLFQAVLNTPKNLTLESSDDFDGNSKPYAGEDKVFNFHSRSLWDWVLSQVQDPLLAPYMEWDAQRLSKFNGTKWVRFYDEPWTAKKFAEVQSDVSKIRGDGKPLAIILWADTSVLSTFGTQKGHYIVARLGNLPMWVRNGKSLGGGRVVGFVPIIQGMVGEQRKPGFVNWKQAVYHEAFHTFLDEVARISKLGRAVRCGDDIFRVLFPYIHILSADYEEQCRLALIRGLNGLSPCAICLVPKGTLSDLRTRYAYRSAATNQVLVRRVDSPDKERQLKDLGLRNVVNALWAVANTDVHEALSYDRLHVDIIGMFQKHILPEIKNVLKDLGRRAQTEVDETYQNMTRWSDLAHFKHGLLTLDFSDGKKWADAVKILLHATYNVMSQAQTPKGFALLRLIRKWHELNMYLSFQIHTEETIPAYERTLDRFHDHLMEYTQLTADDVDVKNWDGIIKLHVHLHAARDIRRKGVIANMDTKVNENLNGPMRKAYQMQTNFKNVEVQVRVYICQQQESLIYADSVLAW